MKNTLKRRNFIKLTVSASGALIAGVHLQSCMPKKPLAEVHQFSPLIKIDTDGWISLIAKNPEIGQGVKTALPMILAEELGANWNKVEVVQADYDTIYDEQWAGGSYAIILNWDLMRTAGAMVRQVLIEAASKKMNLPVEEFITKNSKVFHTKSNKTLPFEELIAEASQIPLPEEVEFKPTDSFEIVGKNIPQVDLDKLVSGGAEFAIDIKLPEMVYATVLKNPVFEGGVSSYDDADARLVNGVIDIIELNNAAYGGRLLGPNSPNFVNGVAVIANSTWASFKGAKKLKVVWDNSNSRKENTTELFERFHAQLPNTSIERKDGDIAKAKRSAASSFEAIYEVPFLAHATMEPMNCTVDFRDDLCEVWAPTQNPEALQEGLIKLFGLKPEQIKIHLPRIGGAFGRRYYVDYAMDTAILSKKIGKPVKLTWTREEDIRHDWYRPGSVQKISASLDKEGMVTGWQHILANASRKTSLGREGGPAGTEIDEYDFPAGLVPNLQLEYGHVLSDVPLGQWRAVAASANAFPVHCFLDELAFLNKMDSIDYFLKFLGPKRMVPVVGDYEFDVERLITVVEKVRQMSGWDTPLPKGQGRGFAARKGAGSFIAEVVTVRVDENEKTKILRVDAVVDCGIVVNPSGAKAQVEGGILEGLCAALYGEITIKDGAAEQSNFHDYKWMRMGEVPGIHIEFIKNELPPRGLGEPPLPPAIPALANAIYAATGKRIRKLPIVK
ncbi:xanthine dehydrogenase family protein molybdopterin-binding subunit [Flagellimonas hymeniacidonis]|uniref:Xanthine dehydrogenase family protein molybdopterin-binding subunit n=1 Tax=Flagellimonas hymeniacidonis TaxID=2603628 RepID=A0A5C8V9A1_9FLAO|nr:molybdopterin cofactor-binding domain-containing protein [Flagellimonas hymeniacidonis]TXN37358.1 xanthine dehydrogenase family protein molybdopterin-binding subunit [Flagellimonas hymeniacidonis]